MLAPTNQGFTTGSILIKIINMKNSETSDQFGLQSSEVCTKLGISRDTLYAYVSRGLIRKVPNPTDGRRSLYHKGDFLALLKRKEGPRARRDVAASTLNWGEPVLSSSITLIEDEQLFYRGKNAVLLAQTNRFEDVVALLIGQKLPHPTGRFVDEALGVNSDLCQPIQRLIALFVICARQLGSRGGVRSASEILHAASFAIAGSSIFSPEISIAQRLASAWSKHPKAEAIIEAALILCADHELNASTYSARVAASARANLGACLLAGAATLTGDAHGGATNLSGAWYRKMSQQFETKKSVKASALQEVLPGFGHPLYPTKDPRADYLLSLCDISENWQILLRDIERTRGVVPTLDFSLAAIEHHLNLPSGAGLGLFALGRTAGWIAHIFEQRKSGKLIRPRANYSGPNPYEKTRGKNPPRSRPA